MTPDLELRRAQLTAVLLDLFPELPESDRCDVVLAVAHMVRRARDAAMFAPTFRVVGLPKRLRGKPLCDRTVTR